jgi:hypothetical protein
MKLPELGRCRFGRSVEEAGVSLAQRTTRRSFLGRLGRGVVALAGGSFVAVALAPEQASARYWYFCGHTYTTRSCPHPFKPLSRVDYLGYPVNPTTGQQVDDKGRPYTNPKTQRRRLMCEQRVPDMYPYTGHPRYGGGWNRCCGGRGAPHQGLLLEVGHAHQRDAAVRGYCYGGRRSSASGIRS